MSSSELSYLYDTENDFIVDYRIAQEGERVKIFIRFALNSGLAKFGDFELRYDLRDTYISEKRSGSSIKLDSSHVIGNGFREIFYAIEFEKKNGENLAVLEIENVIKKEKRLLDIPISTNPNFQHQPFLIFDQQGILPLFKKHVNLGEAIRIKNVFKNEGSFEINGQVNNKPVALPPFDENQISSPTIIPLDTVYGTRHDELFEFNTEGYYTISESQDNTNTSGILVTGKYFPHYGDYKNMTQPLIYVSTSTEFNRMRESTETRKEFENFVVNTINENPLVAVNFIKYYFRRIKNSGFLFTESQEGWKTDKGMLFQIFGKPRQVFRDETSELWVYSFDSGGRVRFIFDIIKGDGGLKEFKLVRGKKYRDLWMNSVTLWRNGQVID